jgi:two-component system KDP operon response regulator KdpE
MAAGGPPQGSSAPLVFHQEPAEGEPTGVSLVVCERLDEACLQAVERLHRQGRVVVVLYSQGGALAEAQALDAGADDCIRLDVPLPRLRARTRAALDRALRLGLADGTSPLPLDPLTFRARLGDREVQLTPLEFRLLARLARQPGRPVPFRELAAYLYDDDSRPSQLALRQLAYRLRRRLRPQADIVAVMGHGYLLRLP